MDWEEKAIIQELRQQQTEWERRLKFTVPKSRTHALSAEVEGKLIDRLSRYNIHRTTHKCSFDLWVESCRVEVKASHWSQKGRVYQAHIKNHDADLVIFDAINGTDHYFIIPMAEITPRKTIKISSYEVETYQGIWAPYLEAWHILDQAVAQAPPRPKQLSFQEV